MGSSTLLSTHKHGGLTLPPGPGLPAAGSPRTFSEAAGASTGTEPRLGPFVSSVRIEVGGAGGQGGQRNAPGEVDPHSMGGTGSLPHHRQVSASLSFQTWRLAAPRVRIHTQPPPSPDSAHNCRLQKSNGELPPLELPLWWVPQSRLREVHERGWGHTALVFQKPQMSPMGCGHPISRSD